MAKRTTKRGQQASSTKAVSRAKHFSGKKKAPSVSQAVAAVDAFEDDIDKFKDAADNATKSLEAKIADVEKKAKEIVTKKQMPQQAGVRASQTFQPSVDSASRMVALMQSVVKETEKFALAATPWVDAHNALFGIQGLCTRAFPTPKERTAFAGSDEFKQIQEILATLPRGDVAPDAKTPEQCSGKFVARVPKSLHAALVSEAEAEGVSLNQLVVAKLAMQLRAMP